MPCRIQEKTPAFLFLLLFSVWCPQPVTWKWKQHELFKFCNKSILLITVSRRRSPGDLESVGRKGQGPAKVSSRSAHELTPLRRIPVQLMTHTGHQQHIKTLRAEQHTSPHSAVQNRNNTGRPESTHRRRKESQTNHTTLEVNWTQLNTNSQKIPNIWKWSTGTLICEENNKLQEVLGSQCKYTAVGSLCVL